MWAAAVYEMSHLLGFLINWKKKQSGCYNPTVAEEDLFRSKCVNEILHLGQELA